MPRPTVLPYEVDLIYGALNLVLRPPLEELRSIAVVRRRGPSPRDCGHLWVGLYDDNSATDAHNRDLDMASATALLDPVGLENSDTGSELRFCLHARLEGQEDLNVFNKRLNTFKKYLNRTERVQFRKSRVPLAWVNLLVTASGRVFGTRKVETFDRPVRRAGAVRFRC